MDGLIIVDHAGVALTLTPDAADASAVNLVDAVVRSVGQRQRAKGRQQDDG